VIDMVFALDMTTHFDLLSKWNDKVKKTVDVKNADDRLLLMKIAFKCANVAFFAKNKELFGTWSERLQKELFNQVCRLYFGLAIMSLSIADGRFVLFRVTWRDLTGCPSVHSWTALPL